MKRIIPTVRVPSPWRAGRAIALAFLLVGSQVYAQSWEPGAAPIQGVGDAGIPKGKVHTVQGISGGTPVPVSGSVGGSSGTLTNRSGSITTGGTAQQLMAANSSRKYLFVQNISSGDLWINFTTTAVQDQPSLKLASGASFFMEGTFVSTELISIIGATTGQKFVAKEG